MNKWLSSTLVVLLAAATLAQAQTKPPRSASEVLKRNFDYVNKKVMAMAEDFPADKYGYKLKPEMRSFGSVIVHIASGNVYAGKDGKGEKVKWDDQEADPTKFADKAAIVAFLKKSIQDANAALAMHPDGPDHNMEPFLSVLQHTSEHYGLLVAYYRANGLVPPESRPRK
ncbi:MAG TPA: hypothetical protein VGL53_01585 [Bryobacteraceae bacterium]|jgi:hypothetical protein